MKLKRFCILIILSLSSLPLFSSSFRVSVLGSGFYHDIVESALLTVGEVTSEELIERVKEREEIKVEKDYYSKLSPLIKNEDFGKVKDVKKEVVEVESPLKIELVETKPLLEDSYYKSENEEIFSYLKLLDSLDMIIYTESEEDGELFYSKVYVDGTLFHEGWVSKDIKNDEEKVLVKEFITLLLDETYSLYSLSLSPQSASLSLDGEVVNKSSLNALVLKEGEHEYVLSSYGYDTSKGVITLSGTSSEIVLSLSPSPSHPLYISLCPWDGNVAINGKKIESKALSSVLSPYTLTLSADGFLSQSYQSVKKDESVFFTLEPLWMDKKESIKEAKGSFYRDIFLSLVSFSTYVALSGMEKIFPEDKISKNIKFVFSGFSIVALVSLIESTFNYYDAVTRGV